MEEYCSFSPLLNKCAQGFHLHRFSKIYLGYYQTYHVGLRLVFKNCGYLVNRNNRYGSQGNLSNIQLQQQTWNGILHL